MHFWSLYQCKNVDVHDMCFYFCISVNNILLTVALLVIVRIIS